MSLSSRLDGLVMRFEPPESKNRWDSPLFLAHDGEDLPYTDIVDALLGRKAPPPNKSTLTVSNTCDNLVITTASHVRGEVKNLFL